MVAKKKAGSKKRNSRKNHEKVEEKPEETHKNPRKYLYLTDQQERAIILRASNHTYNQIANTLNKSYHTIAEWFQLSEMKQALEQENLDIIAEQRDSFGQIVNSAFSAIRENIQADPSLAFAWLKESGFIPKSSSQEAKEKAVKEILERIQNSLSNG